LSGQVFVCCSIRQVFFRFVKKLYFSLLDQISFGLKLIAMRSVLFLILVAGVFGISVLNGCKHEPVEPAETVDPNLASFENMKQHIFKHGCSTSGCHSAAQATNPQHGLVLEGGDVYERLVNVDPRNTQALDSGLLLVKPGVPDSSFLYHKINWNAYPQFHFGNEMPLGANALTGDEIEFIRQWIAAGAPRTGVVADYRLLHAH
jgi:hypothetical protein